MLRKAVLVLMTIGLGASFAAENLLTLQIGPVWPSELWDTKKRTAWDGSVQAGWIFDRKLTFGGGIDFLWNVNKETSPILNSPNSSKLRKVERSFMFPVSGFFALTPIPDFRIHPCASIQLGLNTMYYSKKEEEVQDTATTSTLDENGWYMGFFCKLAADAVLNLGDQSSLFAGVSYQWANMEKLNPAQNDIITQRDMSGTGLRMGFRVLY